MGINILPRSTELQKFGAIGEGFALSELHQRGIEAKPIPQVYAKGDLLITGQQSPVICEVKTARITRRQVRPGYWVNRYQFFVGNLNQNIDHVVILVCVDNNGQAAFFVVPSWEFFGRSHTTISDPDRYQGRLAKYRDAWFVVNLVAARRAVRFGQLPLI